MDAAYKEAWIQGRVGLGWGNIEPQKAFKEHLQRHITQNGLALSHNCVWGRDWDEA